MTTCALRRDLTYAAYASAVRVALTFENTFEIAVQLVSRVSSFVSFTKSWNSSSSISSASAADEMPLPRFDKSRDDRAYPDAWPVITGPVDLVVLEGWCVGSLPQDEDALTTPINELERDQDTDGTWRSYVNDSLADAYANLFARLDALLFLRAPNFDAVYRWRCEQEEKLAATSSGARIMDEEQVAKFIQFFERLTRHNLETVPAIADVVLELDDNHAVVHSLYRD